MHQCQLVLKKLFKKKRPSPKLTWLETLTLIPSAILAHGVGGIKRKARRKRTTSGTAALEDLASTSTRAEAREAKVGDIGGGNKTSVLLSARKSSIFIISNDYV